MKSKSLNAIGSLFFAIFTFGNIGIGWGQDIMGIYESYLVLEMNSNGSTWYDLGSSSSNQDFQNTNLGDFVTGSNSLALKGAQIKTYKCNGGNVTGGNLYYRVYKIDEAAPSFNGLSLTFLSNDGGNCNGNQTWQSVGNAINLLNALTAGTYYLEVYVVAQGWPSTAYANNGGANYKATFRVASKTAQSGNWSANSTWSDNVIPNSSDLVAIQHDVTVESSPSVSVQDLIINASKSLILATNANLTLTGTLTNNGTITIESGATIVQTGANANAGSGTYEVKQDISGSNSGGTPNGRGWYMGSPVSGATSDLFAPAASTNLIYHWKADQTTPSWTQHVAGSASTLEVGKGYAVRIGESSAMITFSSTTLNNAPSASSISIPCYKQSSSTFQGFNLVSNPFASYLDWNDVWTGSNASNFENTIYYRVANSSNVMVFDTYNAETGLSTNTNGSFATRYIPPMQAFWVKVASGVSAPSNAVNLSLTNSMRDHYTAVTNGWSSGLKSTAQDFPMFLRLNIEQGAFKDQTLVYLSPQASSQFDGFDSEKMFLAGYPQVYTKIGNRNVVFNGQNSNKKITVIPVIIDLPYAGVFTFEAEEFNIVDGLILLEDKQEGITQDLSVNDVYTFYADGGTISNRFFIRFHQLDPSISAQGPSNSWVESENANTAGGNIVVATNGRGKVTIQQDFESTTVDHSLVIIRDAAGREVLQGKLSGLESVFQINVPSGIYFVEVQFNGQVEVKKIFVQE